MNALSKFKSFIVCNAIVVFAFVSLCLANEAHAAEISSMRFGQNATGLRIVFDADKEFDYKVFLLTEPQRLVIDTEDINVTSRIEKVEDKSEIISQTRVGSVGGTGARIVFDLKQPAVIKKVFTLPPQSGFSWRFVVDLSVASESEFMKKVGGDFAYTSTDNGSTEIASAKATTRSSTAAKPSNSKKIIVLDPGHGGRDPGAIGYSGVYEKNITLAMGKELKTLLEKGGYKVHLTRSTDIFIPLRDRVKIARKYKADLFISIHADSTTNRKAKGLSVYTLSENASDKEAAALAERENKADVIAGLNLVEHSKEVSDILINLAQRESMNRSSEFATFMVREMKEINLLNDTHRFAGFAVLKAPDVPSVLLEMGYLSNAMEEKLLKQSAYRKKLAGSTKNAVDRYFENMQRASLF